jgi:hypothetical protein
MPVCLGSNIIDAQKFGKKGSAGIIRSDSDAENEIKIFNEGDQIILQQGERHRLIGLDDYCMVAEIWQHTDGDYPSDKKTLLGFKTILEDKKNK